ncbi:CHRD domain-containing protein [Geminicoccus harenae]|uniref:CHRD domain-containing protein n=1 Tax=Geminicoccus harenae TaxID=2498453 RepID=UPI00168B1A00|nr:CHRD domain-containing protein [Geminicoccus harenae]
MIRAKLMGTLCAAFCLAAVAGDAVQARDGDRRGDRHRNVFVVKLDSFQEVPTLVTPGSGSATLRIDGSTIRYTLEYRATESTVTQAHIHIGRPAVNGGISAFLCTNLGNGPAGTPACPKSGRVSGTIRQATGPEAQGVDNIGELIRAIRAGAVYVNVHSAKYPAGEIRGDVHRHGHHH